jgi:transcriptional regulator of acetoin/glycerol metabolism
LNDAPRVHYASRRHSGNVAARRMGIDCNYLYRMMKKHGIARKE